MWKRHSRDNVTTTVMCHHSQVISTSGPGRWDDSQQVCWWARAHPGADRPIAHRPFLSARRAITIHSRLHSYIPDYDRSGCCLCVSIIHALWSFWAHYAMRPWSSRGWRGGRRTGFAEREGGGREQGKVEGEGEKLRYEGLPRLPWHSGAPN